MKCMRFALVILPMLGLALALPVAGGGEKKKYPTFGNIVRLDPRLDKILPKDAKMEKLAGGFVWTEGTVWVKDGGYLLFSDIPNNVINKWKDGEGITKFIFPAGYRGKDRTIGKPGDEPGTNGLRIDPEGRLVSCQHGDRRVARLETKLGADTKPMIGLDDVKWITLADKYMGKRLNSPNDLVFAKNGDLYFTDPPYGLEKNIDDPARELDFQGVYRLKKKGGKLELLIKDMSRPNGIALSPDDKTLYVGNSDPKEPIWNQYEIGKGGKLGKGKLFYDSSKRVGKDNPGLPDGMKVDVEGNLWATGPGGVLIFAPDATLLGVIETGTNTANCAFGDDDGGTLYIAANHDIARIRTSTKGHGF